MANRTTRMTPDTAAKFAGMIPIGRDAAAVRQRIEAMEHLLEGLWTIPGTNRKIGLDTIVGLIPVGGDVITTVMGAWMVWEARNLGMSKMQMARMAGNVGIDFVIGLVPFIGDAGDFLFRSNSRNLRMIRRHLDKHHPSTAILDNKR